jgi:hypothetical protein
LRGPRALPAEARLSPVARVALIWEIVASYVVARWTLRRRGLRPALATLRAVACSGAGTTAAGDRIADGRRLGRAVRLTLRVLPADSRCLMSSLVLTRLLARRGIDSRLIISVRPGERFAAHAWLEHENAALLPADGPEAGRLVTL